MSIIEQKKILYVEYPVPPSRHVSIRVAASQAVNVYALDELTLQKYLSDKKEPLLTIAMSKVGTKHEMQFPLPRLQKWFLVIENPWATDVEVEYAVAALTPAYRGIGSELTNATVAATVLGNGFPTRRY